MIVINPLYLVNFNHKRTCFHAKIRTTTPGEYVSIPIFGRETELCPALRGRALVRLSLRHDKKRPPIGGLFYVAERERFELSLGY